eukprot:COSAG01_NODE_35409_length_532_cov_1.073903_1_plen_87_part_00
MYVIVKAIDSPSQGRKGQLFGGLPVLLAGHLSQLPPVGAPGTWFMDVLNEERRLRGDTGLRDRTPRELTRNFKVGIAVYGRRPLLI